MLPTSRRSMHTTTSVECCKDKGNIHTHKTNTQFKICNQRENMCIEENNIIVILIGPIRPNSNKEEKTKDKGSLDTSIIALLRNTLPFTHNLLLRINLLLIKQDTLLHILEGIEKA